MPFERLEARIRPRTGEIVGDRWVPADEAGMRRWLSAELGHPVVSLDFLMLPGREYFIDERLHRWRPDN